LNKLERIFAKAAELNQSLKSVEPAIIEADHAVFQMRNYLLSCLDYYKTQKDLSASLEYINVVSLVEQVIEDLRPVAGCRNVALASIVSPVK